jgi:hypothetical protein
VANNLYAPPQAALHDVATSGCWRDGKIVVVPVGEDLPHRCIYCNQDAVSPIKQRKVYWHHPAWYILVLVAILLYAIVAMAVRKKALVSPGLCARHLGRKRAYVWVGWSSLALWIGLLFWSAGSNVHVSAMPLIVTGLILLSLVMLFAARTVTAARITDDEVRLRGCGKAFLDSLPNGM